jgi:hypothetical protein
LLADNNASIWQDIIFSFFFACTYPQTNIFGAIWLFFARKKGLLWMVTNPLA